MARASNFCDGRKAVPASSGARLPCLPTDLRRLMRILVRTAVLSALLAHGGCSTLPTSGPTNALARADSVQSGEPALRHGQGHDRRRRHSRAQLGQDRPGLHRPARPQRNPLRCRRYRQRDGVRGRSRRPVHSRRCRRPAGQLRHPSEPAGRHPGQHHGSLCRRDHGAGAHRRAGAVGHRQPR